MAREWVAKAPKPMDIRARAQGREQEWQQAIVVGETAEIAKERGAVMLGVPEHEVSVEFYRNQ